MNRAADYREILKGELLRRKGRNPSYSLRAFARDLSLTPSRLSEILRGRDGLSSRSAAGIARSLAWSSAESRHFVTLVEAAGRRNTVGRQMARVRLASLAQHDEHALLSADTVAMLTQWYHYAIVEMTRLRGFRSDPAWIGARLGVSRLEAEAAVERLVRVGLVERVRGKLRATHQRQRAGGDVPSAAIREFHRQILVRATAALELQPVDAREVSASFFPVAAADLPQAKEKLRAMRRAFIKEIEAKDGAGEQVYCLGVQLFQVTGL